MNFKMIKTSLTKFTIFKNSSFNLNVLNAGNNLIQTQKRNFASFLSVQRMQEKRKKESEKMKTPEQLKLEKEKNDKEELEKFGKKSQENVSLKRRVFASPQEALAELRRLPKKFPNQTLDIVVGLNIDPKRGDQVVRGIFKMPGGSNKIPKLMVFTSPTFHEIAKNAGADFIADATTYKNISEGIIDFEKVVCTLDTLPSLKTYGRILGPKGLMPSVKVGTACTSDNLEKIIRELKMGSREFKTDIWGQIKLPVAKCSFTDEQILKNLDSLMKSLTEKKPDAVKGRYYLYAVLNTYKITLRIDLRSLDPKSPTYFYNQIPNNEN